MKLFKSVLKNGLKNNAIRFKFEAGSICEFEKDDGEIAIDQRDIPDHTLLKELFAAFFPRDAEALAQGKPVRGVLSVVNHGDLILLGVPGATPRLEVFVPPHAERLFQAAWNAVHSPNEAQSSLLNPTMHQDDLALPDEPPAGDHVKAPELVPAGDGREADLDLKNGLPLSAPTPSYEEQVLEGAEPNVFAAAPAAVDIPPPPGSFSYSDEDQRAVASAPPVMADASAPADAFTADADAALIMNKGEQRFAMEEEAADETPANAPGENDLPETMDASEVNEEPHSEQQPLTDDLNIWNVIGGGGDGGQQLSEDDDAGASEMEAEAESEIDDDAIDFPAEEQEAEDPMAEPEGFVPLAFSSDNAEPETPELSIPTPPPPEPAPLMDFAELEIAQYTPPEQQAAPVQIVMQQPVLMQSFNHAHAMQPAQPEGPVKIFFGRTKPEDVIKRSGQLEIDQFLTNMVQRKASDLHLTLGEPLAMRIDGEITRVDTRPINEEQMERLLRPIMPERNAREFAETNDTDFAYEVQGVGRFRVNVLRDNKGVSAVLRLIPSQIPSFESLKLPDQLRKLCELGKGLVLVTGPTGSGKSTTLAAMVDYMNRNRSDHILTIEDPIEFIHEQKKCLVRQREVHRHTASFARALKAALREDPDIILIGEMRDLETVAIAIETAETGHLVLGTLHTNTAASTIDRIIDQFPADQQTQIRIMLAESLKGVVSQTLVKKKGGGRVAAHEILMVNKAVGSMIREGKTHMIASHMQTKKADGNVQLHEALAALLNAGLIDPKDAYMKAVDKEAMLAAIQKKGLPTNFAA